MSDFTKKIPKKPTDVEWEEPEFIANYDVCPGTLVARYDVTPEEIEAYIKSRSKTKTETNN